MAAVGPPVLGGAAFAALLRELAERDLLESALAAAGHETARLLRAAPPAPLTVLARPGLAGAAALNAARALLGAGTVRVLELPGTPSPLAAPGWERARRRFLAAGGAVPAGSDAFAPSSLSPSNLPPSSLPPGGRVLAALGRGALPPELADALAAAEVWALGLPAGMAPDDTAAAGAAVRRTLAPGVLFPAHLFGAAAAACGAVTVLPLPLPPALCSPGMLWSPGTLWSPGAARLLRAGDLGAWLAPYLNRPRDLHKGRAGRVLVYGGAQHPGAALLAGQAALHAGAGLVTVHGPAGSPVSELMTAPLPAPGELPLPGEHAALALGMGLGPQAPEYARAALRLGAPLVLDADALGPDLPPAPANTVLTPHPGEAARMLACAVPEVLADPLGSARRLRERFGGSVVLKGGPSVVSTPEGEWVIGAGSAHMAGPGFGDVLCGVLAALLAYGLPATQAAPAGALWHACAGAAAGTRRGPGLLAGDLSAELGPLALALSRAPLPWPDGPLY